MSYIVNFLVVSFVVKPKQKPLQELIKAKETCVEETKIEENLANESKVEEEVTMRNKSTCKILFEIETSHFG